MSKILLQCVAVFFAVFLIGGTGFAHESGYQHKVSGADVTFEWTVNGENIDIRLSAPTTGWVGIGFNPSDQMKDANFILGYVKKGELRITDEYGKTTKAHTKDTKDDGQMDVVNASGVEENDVTTISFTIPLDSGDPRDQPLIVDGETVVLLAYGAGRDSFRTKHKDYATLKVNLGSGEYSDASGN